MLSHPTLHKLEQLRFAGMAKALRIQLDQPELETMTFMERLGLLVDQEVTERENTRLRSRLRRASLRQQASIENLDYRQGRGLDRAVILRLAGCDWVSAHHNIVITGPTGTGKSYLACALAHRACMNGCHVRYYRLPRLLDDLKRTRGEGTYARFLKQLSKLDVLVLDDWGLSTLGGTSQRDLLELLDDRHQTKSTIATSQLPVEHWHESMEDATLADAILDRLIHNAHKLILRGDSMRKTLSTLNQNPTTQPS